MALTKEKLLKTQSYINGQWVSSQKTFSIFNPSTQGKICDVADLGQQETKQAIEAAHKAFSEWSKKSAKERGVLLRRWYDLIVGHVDVLAEILNEEQGKPISEAKGEILYGAAFIDWFAEEAKRAYGETIPSPIPGARLVTIKQPVGVCALITPWNFPNAMIARKVGPALAAGCTVVIKPAEDTPLSALAMAVLAEEAGIPAGVMNVITSSDAPLVGKVLCDSPLVRKLSFTGSTEVGKILMRQCADTMKKVSFELGGNAPFIVFDDADIDEAVKGAVICKFRNAGQTCVCANRIYVQQGIYDSFASKFVDAVRSVTIGPLINADAVAKVRDHIQDAVHHGARVELGGREDQRGGLFFEPTVLKDVTAKMKISHEETFGPVAPLFKFKDETDVIAQANDSQFGLASYFYTRDIGRAWRVAEALEFGMVAINAPILSTEVAPFGGVKESGIGREGSKHGLDEYMEMKYLLFSGIDS